MSGEEGGGREFEDIENRNVNENGYQEGPEGDSVWLSRK